MQTPINKRKIFNDPVYGFITIRHEVIYDLIEHRYFQRLRRIKQLGMSHYVYPGAYHTRFHHALGALHLTQLALDELCAKGHDITPEEQEAVCIGILLHDIGHGPFSHVLEYTLLNEVKHEDVSTLLMAKLNQHFKGKLSLAIEIFENKYPRKFFHQLVSSQLDVDRLDYLSRDSFYTGVREGFIGSERLLSMMDLNNEQLVIEEKGIYSTENFLMARRLMYWQVYMHKSVVAAENMLVKIIERAQWLLAQKEDAIETGTVLDYFLSEFTGKLADIDLNAYCQLDDTDILSAIKKWQHHKDPVISLLCNRLLNRKSFKCKMQDKPISASEWDAAYALVRAKFPMNEKDLSFLCFKGEATNTLYKNDGETIKILLKTGQISTISQIQNALINESLSAPVKKFYICLLNE